VDIINRGPKVVPVIGNWKNEIHLLSSDVLKTELVRVGNNKTN
jgi:hypothetical protein